MYTTIVGMKGSAYVIKCLCMPLVCIRVDVWIGIYIWGVGRAFAISLPIHGNKLYNPHRCLSKKFKIPPQNFFLTVLVCADD